MKNGADSLPNGRHFFTVKEAAAYCGVNINTIYREAKIPHNKGGPPQRRFGAAIRFPRQKFIAWAENSEQGKL